MLTTMILLAEISDKMAPVGALLLVGAIFALPFALLAYWWRWSIIVAAVPFVWLNYTLLAEINEPVFGEAIIREMGWTYVVGRQVALCVGFAAPLVVARFARWRVNRIRRGEAGLCMSCGYSLTGLVTCPECGRVR